MNYLLRLILLIVATLWLTVSPCAADTFLNVITDFGAVGDGVTDDSPAFQAAANSKRSIFVPKPPVQYKLNNTVILEPTTTGQTFYGEGRSVLGNPAQGLVKIIAPRGKPAFQLSVQHQKIQGLSFWGDGSAGQCGI